MTNLEAEHLQALKDLLEARKEASILSDEICQMNEELELSWEVITLHLSALGRVQDILSDVLKSISSNPQAPLISLDPVLTIKPTTREAGDAEISRIQALGELVKTVKVSHIDRLKILRQSILETLNTFAK